MNTFYSNGKLLLTGEYVVLDGAEALAIPTKFGQSLTLKPFDKPEIIWGSFTHEGTCWFEASISVPKLRLINATFNSEKEGSAEFIAETLQNILREAQKLNPNFLNSHQGYIIETHLTFPKNWGLGTSSTLINNIANWAEINPFTLLKNTFSGSGYDIACAKHTTPIVYTIESEEPTVKETSFFPDFSDELYFVYLNQKQNSREGITRYKQYKETAIPLISEINTLTHDFLHAKSSQKLNQIIKDHEQIISSIIKIPPVKERLFADYFGEVKSLGAWGGDFVLATGNKDTISYFNNKGYNIVIPFDQMILNR